jgi:AraC-like DNA-binding protein
VAAARGREVSLGDGDGVLVNSGEMTAFHRTAGGGSFTMRIPHAVLAPLVIDIDDAVMRLIPRSTGALRLLTSYAGPLLEDEALTDPELRLAVTHAHDLVALTLGATRAAAQVAPRRGLRAARLSAAKFYIAENCTDPTLSIGAVARHLKVTPRHLQKLFEADGGTFSAFLLDQRLARAYRALTNPKFESRQVSAIAYDAGFGDISYFNRCFRHRYGAAPRDIRERPQN